MLRIEHYTKRFGDTVAVHDLSLHIAPGEIYGFIGHNGAGKTTTLKACAGILAPDEGEIYINGLSIRENPLAVKKIIAYLPDNPELYPFLTGIKYLQFIADVFAIPADVRSERIATLAEKFELTGALAQQVSGYSHGMKQRLALIAAFMHEPRLILMDEPFVGLDPQASHLLKTMMREHCERGGAIFFSTHVLDVAERLCDKIAIIKHGELLRAGTTEDVKGDESLEDAFLELVDEDARNEG